MSDVTDNRIYREPQEPTVIPPRPIGKIALALSKAQGAMKAALKDAENPAFKRGEVVSRYADLASAWEACREALSKNELAVVQLVTGGPDPISVTTTLMHSSGEYVSGTMSGKPTKPDVQGIGSTVTYLRRYSLMAMVGIAADDDDGNAASGKETPKAPTKAAVEKELARVQKAPGATYSLETDDGAAPRTFGTPDAFLDALGKVLKDAHDPVDIWTRNEKTIESIRYTAEAAKNDKLVGRVDAAYKFANTKAAELNP